MTEGLCRVARLLDFNRTINLSHKPQACVKANCASHEKESKAQEEGIAEVEQSWRELGDRQRTEEVEEGVEEHVDGGGAMGKVGTPPPVVILKVMLI